MKFWLIFFLIFGPAVCFADGNNQSDNAPMNCDSQKIQTCMQSCAKQLGSNVTHTSAAQSLPKCVDSCSAQGCQVAANPDGNA